MYKFTFPALGALLFFLSCGSVSESAKKEASQKLKSIVFDSSNHNHYTWMDKYDPSNNLVNRTGLPEGYSRTSVEKGSFADWLRHLPLKPAGAEVKLYDGSRKLRQDVHEAVIDIDPGNDDLQQCADACMRLKAEYHYSKGEHDHIHFRFTSGHTASWNEWRKGFRPLIRGNDVTWKQTASPDNSYRNFKSYLKTVFTYAGTSSLSKELHEIPVTGIRPGDIFIRGGFPGHAVMVVDVAEHKTSKEKIFLIAQSYMPAQEIHILKNFGNDALGAWYRTSFGDELATPEWTFSGSCLRRFP